MQSVNYVLSIRDSINDTIEKGKFKFNFEEKIKPAEQKILEEPNNLIKIKSRMNILITSSLNKNNSFQIESKNSENILYSRKEIFKTFNLNLKSQLKNNNSLKINEETNHNSELNTNKSKQIDHKDYEAIDKDKGNLFF